MYVQLGKLPLWAPRSVINRYMPAVFQELYPSTRVIIDATEIRCEVPSSLVMQSGTYSNYKSANTFKALVGVSPDDLLTFASELFMGSLSDREIVIRSGFLNQTFSSGNTVMADKGFKIRYLLEEKKVGLNMPSFLRQDQFEKEDVQETQDIASCRIHVERRIQRIKCYHIFDRPIPLSLGPLINQIWSVCAVLSNMQSPLILESE
ncbi:uncharacterized protein LOC144093950 [Amblyomma americanum]